MKKVGDEAVCTFARTEIVSSQKLATTRGCPIIYTRTPPRERVVITRKQKTEEGKWSIRSLD